MLAELDDPARDVHNTVFVFFCVYCLNISSALAGTLLSMSIVEPATRKMVEDLTGHSYDRVWCGADTKKGSPLKPESQRS